MSERDVQHEIVLALRKMGWYVRVLSAARIMPYQVAGLPDVIAFRHGTTLLVEVKARAGTLRDKQVEFAKAIEPHLADTLKYIVARSLDDVLAAIEPV